jgi:MFS family permease
LRLDTCCWRSWCFFGIGLIMLLVKLYAMDEFGVSETLFGVGLVAPALAIAALSLPLGRLADRLGTHAQHPSWADAGGRRGVERGRALAATAGMGTGRRRAGRD